MLQPWEKVKRFSPNEMQRNANQQADTDASNADHGGVRGGLAGLLRPTGLQIDQRRFQALDLRGEGVFNARDARRSRAGGCVHL